jgi:hypothetical protein
MLQLRGGAGWLAASSESGEDETVRAVDADSSDDDSGTVHNSKYNLSAALLLGSAQYNVTDDVLDLFLRPPPRPTMLDRKPLCGAGLVLSNTKTYKVGYIHAGSRWNTSTPRYYVYRRRPRLYYVYRLPTSAARSSWETRLSRWTAIASRI